MTNQEKNLKIILNDLYQIDPSLKQHEIELIRLISELIKSRPTAEMDKNFRAELRKEILRIAKEVKWSAESEKREFSWAAAFMQPLYRPLGYAILGALLVALLVLPTIIGTPSSDLTSPFAFNATQKGANSFGVLSFDQARSGEQTQGLGAAALESAPASAEAGRGGGGVSDAMIEPAVMPFAPVNYYYTYTGDDLIIDEAQMPVFKRVKDKDIGKEAANYLKGVGLGSIELSQFRNLNVESFTIAEDRDFGYWINVNLKSGEISINKNWPRWKNGDFEILSMDLKEAPADSKIIEVVEKFVREYGIDLSGYGTPEMNTNWRLFVARSSEPGYSVPSNADVVYPLMIEGKEVYETGGSKMGVHFNVDLNEMRVSNVWGLRTLSYESSLYDTETDVSRIIKAAESGSRRYFYIADDSGERTELELGTPNLAYIRLIDWQNNESIEYLVPALVFSVVNAPEKAQYYQETIVVPVIREALDRLFGADDSSIKPLPLPEPLPLPVISEIEVISESAESAEVGIEE